MKFEVKILETVGDPYHSNQLTLSQDAESGIFKTLGDSLRKNPHHLTSNDKEMFQLLYTGCCAFAAVLCFLLKSVSYISNTLITSRYSWRICMFSWPSLNRVSAAWRAVDQLDSLIFFPSVWSKDQSTTTSSIKSKRSTTHPILSIWTFLDSSWNVLSKFFWIRLDSFKISPPRDGAHCLQGIYCLQTKSRFV